jgi:hypothetical protein
VFFVIAILASDILPFKRPVPLAKLLGLAVADAKRADADKTGLEKVSEHHDTVFKFSIFQAVLLFSKCRYLFLGAQRILM